MIEWAAVIALIFVGLILIIVEVIFIPGTTVVAILGLASMVGGIYLSFSYFGTGTGWTVLIVSGLVGLILIVYSFRTGLWKKFALEKKIDSKVNEEFKLDFQVGEVGEALSDLRPIGKGDFSGKESEVRSFGEHISAGTQIQINKIQGNKIFVEPYSTN